MGKAHALLLPNANHHLSLSRARGALASAYSTLAVFVDIRQQEPGRDSYWTDVYAKCVFLRTWDEKFLGGGTQDEHFGRCIRKEAQ